MIVLVLLFPLFRVMADGDATSPEQNNLLNLFEALGVVAILALVAASIPLVKRPQAT